MKKILYHNPRCSKSRQALKILESKNIDVEVIEYLKTPPTESALKALLKKLNLSPEDIIRNKEAKEAGISELKGSALIKAIAKNPKVIQRPIFINNKQAIIARPPELVDQLL